MKPVWLACCSPPAVWRFPNSPQGRNQFVVQGLGTPALYGRSSQVC